MKISCWCCGVRILVFGFVIDDASCLTRNAVYFSEEQNGKWVVFDFVMKKRHQQSPPRHTSSLSIPHHSVPHHTHKAISKIWTLQWNYSVAFFMSIIQYELYARKYIRGTPGYEPKDYLLVYVLNLEHTAQYWICIYRINVMMRRLVQKHSWHFELWTKLQRSTDSLREKNVQLFSNF